MRDKRNEFEKTGAIGGGKKNWAGRATPTTNSRAKVGLYGKRRSEIINGQPAKSAALNSNKEKKPPGEGGSVCLRSKGLLRGQGRWI